MEFLNPINLSLQSIQAEIDEKVASSLRPSDFAKDRFMRLCHERLQGSDLREVQKALSYAKSLPSTDSQHPSMRAYFAHPLRVATFVLRLLVRPTPETVVMGLVHNVFEVSGLNETDLVNAGFSPRLAEGIRRLTIERSRQYDEDYLTIFYQDIETFGSDLALVKCSDRLDNLLGFDLIERSEKLSLYLDLSERFVVAMADHLHPDFGNYLHALIVRMKISGCNQKLKLEHQLFLASTTDSS
jgi:(p)ppGpp synthase/HD superfamily hydrolase